MFLSPILILALLFSSCDDSSKESSKPAAVTLKLTATGVSASGMSSETGDVKTTKAPDEVTGESVDKASIASSALTVTIGASGENSKVEGTIALADGKALSDIKNLTTLVFKNVKIGQNETAYDMTLTGTAYDGTSDSWTITGIAFAAAEEAPAEKVTIDMATGNTEVTVAGDGEGKTQVEALESGSITLTTDNLSEAAKSVVESVSDLKITFAPSKKASVTGTITLKNGVKSTGASILFDGGTITGESMDSVGAIESVTLAGDASADSATTWTLKTITVKAAAKAEPESLDITTIKYSSGANVTATGTYTYASGGSLELQGGSFTPACEGKLTVTVAESNACTVAAEGFKIPATAKDTLSTTGLTWSGNGTLDSQTITKVVIKGTYTEADGGTLTISSLEITKQG